MPSKEQVPKLQVKSLQDAFVKAGRQGVPEQFAGDSTKLLEIASQAPVISLVDSILSEAVARRASDIHIEEFEDAVSIRFRIDGICYQVANPPKSLALAITSRIKILSNLDVAESRLPQDGRILLSGDKRQIDLRVSTLPTVSGESTVLRVLDKGALDKSLPQLGMDVSMQQQVESLIKRPHGMFLVTGPTGSGKTTTLYACLSVLNRPEVKIVTTEDPVEYDLSGLVQVAINQKISLDFSSCLRAILRHDPDIIMVGEIRDSETAQVAVQASLTGHLVFSTLHTNDAPGAVARLIDMGLEPFLITSTVTGVMAQRLIRRLCPKCRAQSHPTKEEQAGFGISEKDVVYVASGCDDCQGLGYKGRMGIFELFVLNEDMRPLILDKSPVSELRKVAIKTGMKTLRQDGLSKVLDGETTLGEVLRETQDYDLG